MVANFNIILNHLCKSSRISRLQSVPGIAFQKVNI